MFNDGPGRGELFHGHGVDAISLKMRCFHWVFESTKENGKAENRGGMKETGESLDARASELKYTVL
jgi:hypothetical protein